MIICECIFYMFCFVDWWWGEFSGLKITVRGVPSSGHRFADTDEGERLVYPFIFSQFIRRVSRSRLRVANVGPVRVILAEKGLPGRFVLRRWRHGQREYWKTIQAFFIGAKRIQNTIGFLSKNNFLFYVTSSSPADSDTTTRSPAVITDIFAILN